VLELSRAVASAITWSRERSGDRRLTVSFAHLFPHRSAQGERTGSPYRYTTASSNPSAPKQIPSAASIRRGVY
jgi:hypothetical protein